MKNNKQKNNITQIRYAVFFSALISAAFATGLFAVYSYTKYLPFALLGIVILYPAFVSLILLPLSSADKIKADSPTGKTERLDCVGKLKNMLYAVSDKLGRAAKAATLLYKRLATAVFVIFAVIGGSAAHFVFWTLFPRATSVYSQSFLTPLMLGAMLVIFVILDRWCRFCGNACSDGTASCLIKNVRSALSVSKISVIVTATASVIKLLGFYELIRYLNIFIAVVFCYETLFILVSLFVRLIRHELKSMPDLRIPMPLSFGSSDLGVISYLEENTGITMRSLWSIKFIKQVIPYAVALTAVILWISTGIYQVESYQQAAVYRLGALKEQPLTPGLHMTLPYPFDRVETVDTETVRKITIGYRSNENGDNIWTSEHGKNEYRLLLGGGNELVSINLRIEYRIDDIIKFLSQSSLPEKLLEAQAYELVTDLTIGTDLNSLLSVDRSAFAESFKAELDGKMDELSVGLRVVSVVLESIHPPIETALVYQESIGAEIAADKYILQAEAAAAVKLAEAGMSYDSALNAANAEKHSRLAMAEADVAEFLAGVSSDNADSNSYRYYKYLNSVKKAYGAGKLILLGEGVDENDLYFGNYGFFDSALTGVSKVQ